MIEIEQYLQAGDIELRAKDIKILLEEHNNMKQEIKRLKEEYVMLQNASDKVEEELQQRIDKAIEYITTEQLYTNYQWGKSQYEKILKDLLEILKGSDKSE